MKEFIADLSSWFYKRYTTFKKYGTSYVSEMPEEPKPFILYVAGENEYQWFAAMVCPCGCKEILFMNLQADTRPCWNFSKAENGNPSLYPSVSRQKGCHAHFWLKNGRVKWC
jgi:hypothetical protein